MPHTKIIGVCLASLFFGSCDLERDNPLDKNKGNKEVVVSFDSFTIASDNNGDQQINKGESIKLKVVLINTGSSTANKVRGTISCTSSYISALSPTSSVAFLEDGSSFNDFIGPGKLGYAYSNTSYLGFNVSNTTPTGTIITFNLSITDESNNTWFDSFTITVVETRASIRFSSFIVSTDNNNDQQINKGESIKLKILLKNNGSSAANKVRGTISCTSSYISALSPIASVAFYEDGSSFNDYIGAGKMGYPYTSTSYLGFNVSNTTPAGTVITFNLSITDESNNTWTDNFTITVVATGASIGFSSFIVATDNNNDQQINKGESIKLKVILKNNGSSAANKVRGTISCASSYISALSPVASVTFYEDGSSFNDYIGAGKMGYPYTSTSYLGFNVSNTTPAGTVITFNLSITDESNNTWTVSFTITVVATGASIGFSSFVVATDNNNDQQINKGESIKLKVLLINNGSSPANKVRGTISCTSSYISALSPIASVAFYEDGWSFNDYIGVGKLGYPYTSTSYLGFNVSSTTPTGTVITFNIAIMDESANTWSDSFTITIL